MSPPGLPLAAGSTLLETPGRVVCETLAQLLTSAELIDPANVRHILISPRKRAQRTEQLLFGDNPPPESSIQIDPDVAEWDYGAYEGRLTKDIRKERPGWEIFRDG